MPQISSSTPAPTMGWVTNKNIGQMSPNEALILTNYFPQANTVDLIKGFTSWATEVGTGSGFDSGFDSGFGGGGGVGGQAIETLMVWNGPTGSKMLAASGGNIFDVSTAGVATSISTPYASNRFQWVNFETVAGSYVVAVNGEDAVINYDGTAVLTSPAVTGVDPTSLVNINVFKNRLFFVEEDSLNFWYLPVGNIGGAASKFPLGQWCSRGGYLMAMGTWTRDGGNGMDDLAVFITSKGECLIYQGSDPSTADDWALVGVFRVGEPIGRRCLVKYTSDLIVITTDGFVPLSKVLTLGVSAASAIAISAQISPTITNAVRFYKNNFGWEGCVYPKSNMIIFNIPNSVNSVIEQYVVNSQTGAWCNFTGHNANCWAIYNEDLYFGGTAGTVYKADTDTSFDGDAIPGEIKTSFNYFGNTAQVKRYQMVRPVLFSSGSLPFTYSIDVDFGNIAPAFGSGVSSTGTPWGSAWGSAWSAELTLNQKWLSGGRQGRCAAFRMRTNTSNYSISLSALDWIMDVGGSI